MPNPDPAHIETDEILAEMEDEIYYIYEQAAFEMRIKAEKYMDWFKDTYYKKREQFRKGDITKEEYEQWVISHKLTADQWLDMADVLAKDMNSANKIAASVINGHLPEVYAVNINYGTYTIEHATRIDTSYTLYDRQTVERLIRDKPDLLPMKAVLKVVESTWWNMRTVDSVATQAVLQGESIPQIADRLAESLPTRNRNAAIRDARTMTTSAENGGRMDALKRAEGMGIEADKTWLATLDGRTRHSHRLLDGETRKRTDEFSNSCMFPGDPNGEPAEVYNCRCRIVYERVVYNPETKDFSFPRHSILGDMDYEDWKKDKGDSPLSKKARNRKYDKEQFEKYKEVLKGKRGAMPRNFKDFQTMKYEKQDEWKKVKERVRQERRKKRK